MCVNTAVQKAASEITAIQDNRSRMIFVNKNLIGIFFFFFPQKIGITADKTYHVNTEGAG